MDEVKRGKLQKYLDAQRSILDPKNTLQLADVAMDDQKSFIDDKVRKLGLETGDMRKKIRILQKNIEECAKLEEDIKTLQTQLVAIHKQIQSRALEVPRAQQQVIQRYFKTSGDITRLRGLLRITSEVDTARGFMRMARSLWKSVGTGFTSSELKATIGRLEADMVKIESQMKDVFDNVMTHDEIVTLHDAEGEIIKQYESLQEELARLPDVGNLSTEHLINQIFPVEQQIMSTMQFLRQQQVASSRQTIDEYEQKIEANDKLITKYTEYKEILIQEPPRGA
jgi:uncharacterized protein (UPF0335 family)